MDHELGILGAGASGLSLALLTDRDHLLIEQADRAGGHAASRSIDGWVFDEGPHIMFSRDKLLLDCMVGSLGDNVHVSRRNNKVAVAGALARYPIENDLAALPLPLRSEALIGMLRARERRLSAAEGTPEPRNLAEWFDGVFGEALTAAYFRPYNEKLWKVPLEDLSMSWADRIPQPPVEDVVRGAVGEVSEGYLHQLHYSYPSRGGYSALMDAWAAGVSSDRLLLGTTVTAVEPGAEGVRVRTTAGDRLFGTVASTIPLKRLVEFVPGVPAEVRAAVDRLRVNPIIAVTLGFAGEDPNRFTAVYIPDSDYLPNRISFPAVFSPHNAPPDHFSVQAEICCTPADEVLGWTDQALTSHVLAGLRSRRLVPDGAEHVFTWVERFPNAYVVYTTGYEDDVQIAVDWFAARGIILHGRFGAHQYLNVDGCIRSSLELARRLGHAISDEQVRARFQGLAVPA